MLLMRLNQADKKDVDLTREELLDEAARRAYTLETAGAMLALSERTSGTLFDNDFKLYAKGKINLAELNLRIQTRMQQAVALMPPQ